ncbi:hypothetical protein [Sphingomonas arenae]|uniref:hypothetical protein n=1 Tax=Sphingomonas arenae TaxID=2812555 RepID=UPI001967F4E7|nr:hypothetical protein [Sphingomonas arenae]
MMGAESILAIGILSLAGLVVATIAALKGWQGWLELKKMELAGASHEREPSAPVAGGRIEIADLRERVRKLEAIAAGIDY